MAKKKNDETQETVDTANDAIEETAVEAGSDDAVDAAPAVEEAAEAAPAEEKPKKTAPKKAAPKAKAAKAPKVDAETAAKDTDGDGAAPVKGKRAEKIGVVASDKMTKTVVVRVDRVVKHPVYRKYVRQRKKFMAHDELGSKIGDKVRIIETRPLSARKRWRVVEIIQKAEL